MKYFLLSLTAFSLVILAMAVGVIFSNKRIKGSCGGLGAVMDDECDFCENKSDCPERNKAQLTT